MKYIHLVITNVDCENESGYAMILDECKVIEKVIPFEYPNNIDEKEIALMLLPNLTEYKMTYAHVGGGGIKRPS